MERQAFRQCRVQHCGLARRRDARQDTAALVDDADKLGKSLQNWCTIRHGQHTSMTLSKQEDQSQAAWSPSVPAFMWASRQMEMQEEQKALQSAAKLMCQPLLLSLE